MISKSKKSWIQSLKLKKFRDNEGCFIAEGEKIITELASTFACQYLIHTSRYQNLAQNIEAQEYYLVSESELQGCSLMKSPQGVVAIFKQQSKEIESFAFDTDYTLILDEVQDPGNMGTIIRIADWFGIRRIVCSPGCADLYNPKVVQATMGAMARVEVGYTDLRAFLQKHSTLPVYGTFLEGESLYDCPLDSSGFIVMGNEGNGISKEVEALVSHKVLIPAYTQDNAGNTGSESLNVGVATAIICGELRRQLTNRNNLKK